jgi:NADH-quinone oxidoreductase subunit I
MAPLLPGMEQPPHPMRLGNEERDYYVRDPKATAPAQQAAEPVLEERT